MAEISAERARQEFGITTLHQRMANGELRFRLRKTDGTAYIRTEATAASGWQNSHFHEYVMETYVVQSGCMAFAELVGTSLSLCLYGPGENVTSRPGIVHNVYLFPGAVIHTVKHGTAKGEDRLTDARAAAFDLVTHALKTDVEVRAAAIIRAKKASYTDEYRHFDNLIWQVPAWSTGIFAISIQALFEVLKDHDREAMIYAALLSLFTGLCLSCFSFVMMRFRTHQRALKGYLSTPRWLSASTFTQCLITLEAAALLGVALRIIGVKLEWSVAISGLTALIVIILFERSVRREKIRC